MKSRHIALALAAIAAPLAFTGGQVAEQLRGQNVERAPAGVQQDPSRPTPACQQSQAKLRDLFFRRNPGNRRPTYKGLSMSVAQGKRLAKKRRNIQRHKKQWKDAVR